jgi:hypothetical protein
LTWWPDYWSPGLRDVSGVGSESAKGELKVPEEKIRGVVHEGDHIPFPGHGQFIASGD